MNNTLYFRYLTEADRCPECRDPYSIQCKDGVIYMVCYSCGWEQETEKFGRIVTGKGVKDGNEEEH